MPARAARWRRGMLTSNRTAGAVILMAALIAGCAPHAPPVAPPAAPPRGRCGKDFGATPFKDPKATHFLVADFYGAPSSEPNFGDTISTQVTRALRQFKEEELPKLDVKVPPGTLEIE